MTDESSNTAPNSKIPGKPFRANDPRINRKGRPKSFDALRAFAQEIAHETAKAGGKNGEPGQEIVIDGHRATVTEMILRQWATSKDPRLQMAFIEFAYGKPPQTHQVTGADGGPLEVAVKGYRTVSPDEWPDDSKA